MLYLVKIGINSSTLISSNHFIHIDALRSQYHKRNTEDGIGTCGENQQALVAIGDGESHFGTLTVANPIALGLLDGLGPLDGVQITQETTGIGRYTQAPLAHHLLLHRITTADGNTLAHLIVGKHCTQLGTPVHHRVAKIGDAIVHEHIIFLNLGHGVPLIGSELVGAVGMCIATVGAMFFKVCYQLIDGTCLVKLGVVIALEHLQESPLCPLVIFGVTSLHFTVPVIAETYFVKLLTVTGNVLVGSDFGMLTCLNSILFGGKTVGIITHGMQYIKSTQALVTCIDIASNITQRMTHMQTCSRRIGEHVKYIEFRAVLVNITLVGVVITPILLPLFLYFLIIIVHFSF